jgi:hypothetical protein
MIAKAALVLPANSIARSSALLADADPSMATKNFLII